MKILFRLEPDNSLEMRKVDIFVCFGPMKEVCPPPPHPLTCV